MVLFLTLLNACSGPPAPTIAPPPHPPPTEFAGDEESEERNREARKIWMSQMHRAPPGVDVKAVERANGLAQISRRRALRLSPPAVTDGAWVERGSDNQAGRMHAARLNAEGDTLYAGSSLGGLWRGDPEGGGWEPLGDNLYGGAHWLEVLSGDSGEDVLVVATSGGLVHRSADGGETWSEPGGLGSLYGVRRLLKIEDGSDTLFILTTNADGAQLRRSTDQGESFSVVADLGAYSGDVWAPRDGEGTLYLAGAGGQIGRSEDLGDTWTSLGVYDAASGRAELAGSEAGAPRLWLISDGAHLWRSDDAGVSWVYNGDVGDYYSTLNASIEDADLFAYGGVNVTMTEDGGASFHPINEWWEYYGDPANLLHADLMGMQVQLDSLGQEIWYICTDGGVYQSKDGLSTVENLSLQGLRVSQYYSTLTSSKNPEHIAAGAQDQGYQITNGLTQDDDLYEFTQSISGDYGHLTSSDGSHDFVYSVYPGFILVQVGEDSPWLGSADFPGGESYVPWLPPIVADPDVAKAFFFPATKLYRYLFDPSTGTATASLYSSQNFSSDGYEYLSAVQFSPLDSDKVFAATSYGRFFASTDKGLTWTLSPSLVPDENWYYGQAIVASRNDEDLVYVGGSGYGVPAVWRSTDGGASFGPWGDGLPDTLVYSMCEAPDDSGQIFVGTETSVYTRSPGDESWTDITDTGAPITLYWSCESLVAENTIRFGTYGRGIWDYQLDPDNTGCYPVQDFDGDGVDCETDCDDHDVGVLPGAEELCDGKDVNCDETDLVEVDADGDGFLACEDCDDTRAGLYPGATEICADGLDQDCSGADLACEVDDEPEVEDTGVVPKEKGCGCASGGGDAGWVGLFLGLLLIRRRRV